MIILRLDPNSWFAPVEENQGVPVVFHDYLELNGGVIDLDVQGKSGLEAEADMEWLAVPNDACFLGARTGNTRFYLIYDYPTRWNIGYGNNYNASSAPVKGTRYTVVSHLDAGEQWCKVNGESVISRTVAGTFDTGRNLFLGAINHNGAASYSSNTRVYSLIIRRKNGAGEWETIRDLRPARLAWTPGMFDSVEGKFLAVSGGLSQLGSEVIGDTQPEYLEFIDSDSSGYADTGIIGKTGLEAELDLSLLEVDKGGDQGILTSRENNNRFYLVSIYPSKWNLGYVNNYGEATPTLPDGGRHIVHSRCFKGDQELSVDGVVKVSESNQSEVDTKRNLVLFAYRNGDGIKSCGAVRFYGGKIWRHDDAGGTNVLVRDFRPALCGSKAALFDEVSRKFFFNGGNPFGSFVAGPRLSKSPRSCEYVESDGANFVDLEVPAKSGLEVEAELMWNEVPNDACVLGARMGNDRFYMIYDYPTKWNIGYGVNAGALMAPVAGTRYKVATHLAVGEQWCKVDGETVISRSSSDEYDLGIPLHLFSCNIPSDNNKFFSKARIYSLKLKSYDAGSGEWGLVRDLQPSVRDGVACFYDKVSRRCFYPFQLLGGVNAHPLAAGPLRPVGLTIVIY